MKFNKILVLGTFLLVLFLCMGISIANENITIESVEPNVDGILTDTYDDYDDYNDDYEDYEDYDDYDDYNDDYEDYDDEEGYNAKIIAKDVTLEYSDDDYEVIVYLEDNNHNPIEGAEIYFEDYLNSEYDENGYYHFFPMYYDVGTHKIEFTLDDGAYKAEPVSINFKITKSIFYGDIICKSYYGTTSGTLTMKATVYNPYQDYYEDGYVTFKVNGKSYKVKTKNGVATKSIKIKKTGTYTYTAQFSNKNYASSAYKGKAKLYVYSISKKSRTFKIKGYKVVVSVDKYNKLINAKNTNKLVSFKFNTNKKFKQRVGHYKYKLKTVKAKVSIVISYGGKTGGQSGIANRYSMYLTTPYQNPGWSYCSPWVSGFKKSSVINKLN